MPLSGPAIDLQTIHGAPNLCKTVAEIDSSNPVTSKGIKEQCSISSEFPNLPLSVPRKVQKISRFEIDLADEEKTAFTTHFGLYLFQRMSL